ncbi:TauD/TfdA family dioxygenase [Micromonospora yangpuensis]|uniref:Taurine catabolism dioxygenase TauD, TfdA family n=1 Tax=Micromonospora yangpuensis TaxID=683228 RepID=A0A1C6US26_9ACTN|nr:TauD/TfdA family dioxygenase [Micromonospora yangpuensis]GGM06611.1 hypothetical protein GCM10012279_25640 [Micromonospora yangpuensis]SCL56781.1 Taurine catabolism dioxygenase TauD, TfdA family [Micromonospora yangpuensis]
MRLLRADGDTEIERTLAPAVLARDGLVLVKQCAVAELTEFLQSWTRPFKHPHETRAGLTVIRASRGASGSANLAAFSCAALRPHTDRSLHPRPPAIVASVMVQPASVGGHALLVDGATLSASLVDRCGSATVARLRLTDANGRVGPVIATLDSDGLAQFRYRDDEIARPDGPTDAVMALRQLIAQTTRQLTLQVGEGYILHNHRILHGRTAFTGSRQLIRLLGTVDDDHPHAWLNQGFPSAYA